MCGNDRENMILLGLGSNLTTARLTSSQEVLEESLKALEKHNIRVVRRSSWYRSAPVPPSAQPWFVNGVAEVETGLPPRERSVRGRPEPRHQLFLAFKEALTNVVCHAAATEVRIAIEVRAHESAVSSAVA